ncbi:MAG: hypothetical protein RIG84_12110 [Roseovarius sp.]
MQDKTIDNALLALRRQGGTQGKLAEVLLDMRGVQMPAVYHDQPLSRGGTKRIIMDRLRERPQTAPELTEAIREVRPHIARRDAYNRAYQALLRLEEKGVVRREGRVWLAQ